MDYIFNDAVGDYDSYDDDQRDGVDQESLRAKAQRDRRERNRDHDNWRQRDTFDRGFFADMMGSIRDSLKGLNDAIKPLARRSRLKCDCGFAVVRCWELAIPTRLYTSFDELAADYEAEELHPGDLKPALAKALNKILQVSEDKIAFLTKGEDPYDDDVVLKPFHPNLKLLIVKVPRVARYYTKVFSMLPGFSSELMPKGREKESQAKLKRYMTMMDSMTNEELDSTNPKLMNVGQAGLLERADTLSSPSWLHHRARLLTELASFLEAPGWPLRAHLFTELASLLTDPSPSRLQQPSCLYPQFALERLSHRKLLHRPSQPHRVRRFAGHRVSILGEMEKLFSNEQVFDWIPKSRTTRCGRFQDPITLDPFCTRDDPVVVKNVPYFKIKKML
ncbi:hypothetical protein Droror1_Dr00006461 [Drosera rotundifolia]